MDFNAIKVFAVVAGIALVLGNKQLADITGHWQTMIYGRSFGGWPNRIPIIIVGVLAVVLGIFY